MKRLDSSLGIFSRGLASACLVGTLTIFGCGQTQSDPAVGTDPEANTGRSTGGSASDEPAASGGAAGDGDEGASGGTPGGGGSETGMGGAARGSGGNTVAMGGASAGGEPCETENGGCGDPGLYLCSSQTTEVECTERPIDEAGCDARITEDFGGGSGTEEDPFLICSRAHLEHIDAEMRAVFDEAFWFMFDAPQTYFLQTRDIDLEGEALTPIGIDVDMMEFYAKLSYDGGNRAIRNLRIESAERCTGLFSMVGQSVFRNMNLEDVISVSTSAAGAYAGALVGCTESINGGVQFENVHVTGGAGGEGISAVDGGAGGLIGYIWPDHWAEYRTFDRTSSDIRVAGREYVGGLVGHMDTFALNDVFTIYRSHSRGDVVASGENAGGLAGFMGTQGRVISSYSTSDVTAVDRAGGLIGYLGAGGLLAGTYASGSVTVLTTNSFAGGLVGRFATVGNDRTILNSYALGALTREDGIQGTGGLFGGDIFDRGTNIPTIEGCYFEHGREPNGGGEKVENLAAILGAAVGQNHFDVAAGITVFPTGVDVSPTGEAGPLDLENVWGEFVYDSEPSSLPGL